MKAFSRVSLLILSVAVFTLGLVWLSQAATTVNLGTAVDFAVLAGSTVTNTGSSTISGDVGLSPGTSVTGFPPGTITGTQHVADAVAVQAQTDLTTAYNSAAGQAPASVATELGGTTKTAGVYDAADGTFMITGTLTLDAQGDPDAVFIFKTASTLTTAGASRVVLANGAQACHVFWQVGSSATLGANSTFKGSILALTSVTLTTGANVEGRVLARNGAVTLDGNVINKATCAAPAPTPATLYVVKQVVNDNGGTATASLFSLHVKLAGTDVSGSPAAGTTTPGTAYSLAAGTYVVSEDANASYTKSFGDDCDGNGSVTLASGQTKTCTITNDDIAPVVVIATSTINVVKVVTNDNNGTKTVADFPLFVNGASVVSGATNDFPAGAYVVTETADPNYTRVFSGDCNAAGHFDLAAGQNKVCVVTNDDIAPVVAPAPSGGGGSGSYISPVPPLIEVVKVPSPLALPAGPGPVTYTYTLRNLGTVAVSNITMVGDSCSPITLVSGDTNADARLGTDETWIYRCAKTLSATHTNTVVATGWANNISTTDIASATVVVGVPVVPPLIHVTKMPNPLTLPAGGGTVTYTKKVTNPGTAALSNVRLTDDKCDAVKYISGDTNGDSKLDPNETWTYTCQAKLVKTTTNTVTASGEANGLTARDFAIATVVVAAAAVPKLPNTGLSAGEAGRPWNTAVLAGAFVLILASFIAVFRKRTS